VKNPLVIAHRGASGYRPENTLASFELGILQGADGIELDVIAIKDNHLVIRHENILSGTTNIASLEEFRDLKRDGTVEGVPHLDWYSEDLTLNQIKSLRAVERIPEIRPGSAKFDNQFEIPSLAEVLVSPFLDNKIVVVELKSGTHLATLQGSLGKLTAQVLLDSKVQSRGVKIYLESFDLDLLLEAKTSFITAGVDAEYFLAIDSTKIIDVDLVSLASELDGLSIATHMLLSTDSWVTSCHDLGLAVWVYTARVENAKTTIEEYYEELIQTGVDGIFADQPDLLRRVLSERG
jgi:glycerophosphoryl diester phosphodiesterase